MTTFRDKILSRIEECERTGNITDVSGLYTALSLLDEQGDQTAKADSGKPQLMLVPPAIITDIAIVREYGNMKYGDPENWRDVEEDRYWNALARHFVECMRDRRSKDSESGLPHRAHMACNLAFICEMEWQKSCEP